MPDGICISAVIPVFNREKTISRAIDSVLAQHFAPTELLVVDDGSQDGTERVVSAYGPRLRLLKQAHGGVSAARNRGVQEAKGDWIAFLDSDDYWLPGHLARMAAAIRATQGEAAVYFSDMAYSPEETQSSFWQRCAFHAKAPFEFRRDAMDWTMMRIQPMMFQASVIARQAFLKSGALPESLRTKEDTLMFFKLGLLHPMCAVAGCGTVMMADGGSRLTKEMDSGSIPHCEAAISVCRHLLTLARSVGHSRQKFFEDELGRALFSMARAAYRQKAYGKSVSHLLQSGFRSPNAFAGCLAESLREHARRASRAGSLQA